MLDRDDEATTIYHVVSPFWPVGPIRHLVPPVFSRAGAKLVVTLYDMIPLIYSDTYLADPSFRQWYMTRLKFIEDADLVLAISKATREDAIRLLGLDPDRIKVVYIGVSDFFRPADASRDAVHASVSRRLPMIRGPYLFYPAGTGQFRKNVTRVIEAYASLPDSLRRSFQLAISGHMLDHEKASFLATAERLALGDRLVLTGFVDDETLLELYQAAELCLYPSLYEGFGLPILEAMRCSTPVVTSDCSSMKELVEIDEARFDPEDVESIAGTIEHLLTDGALRQRVVAYGTRRSQDFSWRSAARQTADAYRQLATSGNSQGGARKTRRRQLAICTPFPPEESGIADYNRRLLEVLCARHPVDAHVVVRDDPLTYPTHGLKGITPISVRQFRWLAEHGYYDSIVHCMGNSPHHGYIYELMKEYPGTVWLHDIRLTDFYRWYFQEYLGRSIKTAPGELLPWASRYPAYTGDLLLRDNVTQHVQGIYLAGEVASLAQKLIVGSGFSKELVQIESGANAPVIVIPHAALSEERGSSKETWTSLAARYDIDSGCVPIVSIGITWSTKCPETLISAFAKVAADGGESVLVFVGYCNEGYRRELENYADRLGVRRRVYFTGYVDERELDAWLAACSCAVQLRFPTNGESSGAVMRCLAAGVSTIVSDHGPLRELPDDAVVKVPAQVEAAQLGEAIEKVISSEHLRAELRRGALRYSSEVSLEAISDRLWTEVLCVE